MSTTRTADSSQGSVTTIIASAGTGKTYTLVEEIQRAIIASLDPARLLATTFTKRAAGELMGRIRAALIAAGQPDRAAAMLAARVGTVNSVCGALVAEFALELGRSPLAEVVAEDREQAVFAQATDHHDPGGMRRMRETIVARATTVHAWALPDVAIRAELDAETNFTLFGPLAGQAAVDALYFSSSPARKRKSKDSRRALRVSVA